jgi:hypothetical protein
MKQPEGEITLAGWHLRKEVTMGQIFTLASLFISGIWWANSVENRFVLQAQELIRLEQKNELTLQAQSDRFDRYQASVDSAFKKIDASLMRIEDRMNRERD